MIVEEQFQVITPQLNKKRKIINKYSLLLIRICNKYMNDLGLGQL